MAKRGKRGIYGATIRGVSRKGKKMSMTVHVEAHSPKGAKQQALKMIRGKQARIGAVRPVTGRVFGEYISRKRRK